MTGHGHSELRQLYCPVLYYAENTQFDGREYTVPHMLYPSRCFVILNLVILTLPHDEPLGLGSDGRDREHVHRPRSHVLPSGKPPVGSPTVPADVKGADEPEPEQAEDVAPLEVGAKRPRLRGQVMERSGHVMG